MPVLLRPAMRHAIRQRMVRFRPASIDRVAALTGRLPSEIQAFRRELSASALPDVLINRGAGLPFTQEFPQAALLYLLIRSQRPQRVIETGVRPGYTTAWILAALEANGAGSLHSLGPGPTRHRIQSVRDVTVGQFVPPALRGRWTLVLGNTEDNLRELLAAQQPVDLFFYDNGPDADRARFELHSAWAALSPHGILLAHHVDANPAWSDFCRAQGVAEQILDPGPPRLGAVGMSRSLHA
jgi:predicted O-methyltransferase YrrM